MSLYLYSVLIYLSSKHELKSFREQKFHQIDDAQDCYAQPVQRDVGTKHRYGVFLGYRTVHQRAIRVETIEEILSHSQQLKKCL